MENLDEFNLGNIDNASLELKVLAMQEGGGEVVEDTGDDCESGACKI